MLGLLRLGGEQLTLIVLEVLQKENLTQPERTQCWLLYFYSSIIHPEAITPPGTSCGILRNHSLDVLELGGSQWASERI